MIGQLYTLRYRHGNAGVMTEFVEADNLQQATAIGEAYVNQLFNARFIKVSKAIVADVSILTQVTRSPEVHPPAPDDEASMPVEPKVEQPKLVKPTPPPPNPALEKALDAADEDEDRKALLLQEQEEVAADSRARNNRADPDVPPPLPPLKHKK